MTSLPVSIEQYLLESGFSGTEILILKHLIEGGAMTLRELAAKTGKSTGVLDSASKKLLGKGILARGVINDTPKLKLSSSEAIVEWVREDRRVKQASSERREKDLESFIASLSVDISRADIQHYEGPEGLQKAYLKLLEECAGTMLHFLPVRHTEVEDPLRDFFVQFFRLRHRGKIITRVIAHDTPLGRRYQSRDPFEYRQTLLVPEDVYAFNTEKVVAGDWVGTFNHAEQKAFLIRSKEMAQMENVMFQAMWKQETLKKVQSGAAASSIPEPIAREVEVRTKMVSSAREFFLSRKSITVFAGIALVSASLTLYLYHYTKTLEFRRMQEAVLSIAATGASQFSAKDLDALRVEKDWRKPEWTRVVSQLENIRTNNKDVTFVYLFRKTKNDPTKMEFIADSHSRNPYANIDDDSDNDVDADSDGVIDPDGHDKLQWPGQPYPDPVDEIFQAHEKPTASQQVYEDEFGAVLSGFSPVKDNNGNVAGVIGVDMKATLLDDRIQVVFRPFLYFMTFFLLLACVRFTAFNRSLMKEFLSLTTTKTFLVTICVSVLVFIVISYAMYLQTLNLIKEQTAERLKAIASTTAMQIDYRDLVPLRIASDMNRPEYQRVFSLLDQVRKENLDVKWAFILRPTDAKDIWEFVVDADANFDLPTGVDDDGDGTISASEENVYPGFHYDVSSDPVLRSGLLGSVAANEFHSDQWGTYISGFAPIKDRNGNSIAVIGFDIEITDIVSQAHRKVNLAIFASIVTLFLFFTLKIRAGVVKLNMLK